MKKLGNFTLRFALFAIGISLACISAYLTATYMYNLGEMSGYGAAFMGAGVLLDFGKTLFPVACFAAWAKGHKIIASLGLALSLAVMLTSFNISISTITDSHNRIQAQERAAVTDKNRESLQQSAKYQGLLRTIEAKEQQLALLEGNQRRLYDANFITKANHMQDEISQIARDISDLNANLGTITIPDTVEYSDKPINSLFVAVIAGLIEIMSSTSLVLASVIVASYPSKAACVESNGSGEAGSAQDADYGDKLSFNHSADAMAPVVEAEPNEPDDMVLQARVILLDGAKPSERSLQTALSITRRKAGEILKSLECDGFLTRDNRGHRQLAAA